MCLEAASGGDPRATRCVMCVVGEYWLRLAVSLGKVRIVRPEAVCCVPV